MDKKVALLWLGNGNIRNIYEISTPSRNVTTTNRDRLATSPPKVVSKSWSCLLTRGLTIGDGTNVDGLVVASIQNTHASLDD